MTFKEVFQAALDQMEWDDDIAHDDSDNTDFINTGYSIDGQSYRLILVTDEDRQRISISMKSPISIPKNRQKDGAFVVNALNVGLSVGNLEFTENGSIYYRWAIDVDGSAPSADQIKTLIGAAGSAFDELRASMLGKVAFTKQTGEEIVAEYREAVSQMSSKDDDDSTPSEL